MIVVALDPGKTTGAAYVEKGLFMSEEMDQDEVWPFIKSFADYYHAARFLIVVESFLFRPRTKADLTPVEVIGCIKEQARQYGLEICWQTPSQVKAYFTDQRLEELDRLKKPK